MTLLSLALAVPVALVACRLVQGRGSWMLPRLRPVRCQAHRKWDYRCGRCDAQHKRHLEVRWTP